MWNPENKNLRWPSRFVRGWPFLFLGLTCLTAGYADSVSILLEKDLANVKLINWMKSNVSPLTGLPFSFYILDEKKSGAYQNMGSSGSIAGVIERTIVEEGLDIYDAALWQIVLATGEDEENLSRAGSLLATYWQGKVGELTNIRAGYPVSPFVYNPYIPEWVSSSLTEYGKRGFLFRIINANGRYLSDDPLDGKTKLEGFPNNSRIHWEDWKPVAGENAWVVMAAMHVLSREYAHGEFPSPWAVMDSIEFKLAAELARAAMSLQADNGAIRMAPIGTFREFVDKEESRWSERVWWYNQISSENNFSWYAAMRMLYEMTGQKKYWEAMLQLEKYLRSVWNEEGQYFYQGQTFADDRWQNNEEHFALDVQTWSILCLGVQALDDWFGEGTAFKIWQTARERSGVRDEAGKLLGVGYTDEHDRLSVEWTASAILVVEELADYYAESHPEWVRELKREARDMRQGIESLRVDISQTQAAYAYSSKRDWIPFGWNSHSPEVLSLASTGWVVLINNRFNPFRLEGSVHRADLETAQSRKFRPNPDIPQP